MDSDDFYRHHEDFGSTGVNEPWEESEASSDQMLGDGTLEIWDRQSNNIVWYGTRETDARRWLAEEIDAGAKPDQFAVARIEGNDRISLRLGADIARWVATGEVADASAPEGTEDDGS